MLVVLNQFSIFIISILSAFSLFVPVFSGYLIALVMLFFLIGDLLRGPVGRDSMIKTAVKSRLSGLSRAILIFFVCCIFSAAAAAILNSYVDQRKIVDGLVSFFVKNILLWFIYLEFSWRMASAKVRRVFSFAFALFAVINLSYCLFQRSLGWDWLQGFAGRLPDNRYSGGVYRVSGFMGHPLTLAYCQVLAVIAAMNFGRISSWRWEKIAWHIGGLSCFAVILISGSRGPQLVMAIALIMSISAATYLNRWRQLLAILAMMSLVSIKFGFFARFSEIFQSGFGGDQRVLHWTVFWNLFKDHVLFGVGPGGQQAAISAYYSAQGANANMRLAHNAFLQYAAEFGVLGLMGLLVWIAALVRFAYRLKIFNRAVWAMIAVMFLGALTQNNLQDSEFVLAFTVWILMVTTTEVEICDVSAEGPTKPQNFIAGEGGSPS